MKSDWENINKLYSVNGNYIWLNNAGTTPCGRHITRELANYIEEYSKYGILSAKYPFNETLDEVQKILAGLFNADKEDIALIHNTNEGMSFISFGLDLKEGDEILLLQNEYPSNVYPWEHWIKKGIKLKFVDTGVNEDEFLDNFKKEINGRTRAVSFSAVHWCTGMVLPLKEIGLICRNKGIIFIVDAAQGAGHVPINVREYNIDFMALSAWKWLLGPLGLGVLVIPRKNTDKINFIFKGTNSVVNDQEYIPYKNEIKNGAARFMNSTGSFINYLYFKKSLEMLNDAGFDRVMKRIYFLSGMIIDRLKELDFNVMNGSFKTPTGIVTADRKGIDMDILSRKLKEHNVIAPVRLGRLRLSPHIYISEKQIDDFAEILKNITCRERM